MTDQQTLVIALGEVGRIIAEYLEPGPHDADETIKQLLAVLDNRDLARALAGAGRRHVSLRYESLGRHRREILLRHHRQTHRPHPGKSPPDDLLTFIANELAAPDLGIETLEQNALGVETVELCHPREKDVGSCPAQQNCTCEIT